MTKTLSYFLKSSFYRKILVVVLLTALIPTFISAFGSYFIGTSQIQKQLENTQKVQLGQLDQMMKEQFNSLEQTMIKWTFNNVFSKTITSKNIIKDYQVVNDLFNVLAIIQNSHSLISDVAFYDESRQLLYNQRVGMVKLDQKEQENMKDITSSTSVVYYKDNSTIDIFNSRSDMNMLLVTKLDLGGTNSKGVIIVSINRNFVEDMLKQLHSNEQGLSFVICGNGTIVYNQNENVQGLDTPMTVLVHEVQGRATKSGDFVLNFKDESYSVAFGTYERNGWKYVTAVPMSKMFEPVRIMSQLLLLISLLAFAILLGISLFFTRYIYKPVRSLSDYVKHDIQASEVETVNDRDELKFIKTNMEKINLERKELTLNIDKNRIILKEGFLLQLLQKHLSNYTEEELLETMKRVGWKIQGSRFAVIDIRLYIPDTDSDRFSHGDEQLATYAAVNIVEEMVSENNDVLGVISFHNLSLLLIMQFDNNVPATTIRSEVEKVCKLVTQTLSGYLGMQVVMGVGRVAEKVSELPRAFDEAVQVTQYRDINRKEEIIFSEDILPELDRLGYYPASIEDQIISSIKNGMKTEVVETIGIFAQELCSKSGKAYFIQQNMLHLLGNILHAILQTGNDINKIYAGQNLYEQLCGINDPEEMVRWFENAVIEPWAIEMARTQEQKNKKMINLVTEYIQKNYMKDISLDICADELGIPPKRLSVLFRRITDKNFINYVTWLRISKAKELLRETDESINDIAYRVGYQPSYFNRTFKKHEGVTPGDYRLSCR